jgi:hypothetical protein
MPVNRFTHDPHAKLDYSWSWVLWLADEETITSQTVTGPTGVTVSDIAQTAGVVTAWIVAPGPFTGLVLLVCHITTSAGREDDRTIVLTVMDR